MNGPRSIEVVRPARGATRLLPALLVAGTLVACGARTNLTADELSTTYGTSSTFGEKICQGVGAEATLERQEATVMILVDRSASMLEPMEGDSAGRSRWNVLSDALSRVLPSVNQDAKLGLSMFPATDVCDVAHAFDKPLPPLASQRSSQVLSLVHGTYPGGGKTPTFAALGLAREALLKQDAGRGPRSVILITDGVPNCNGNLDATECPCTDPAPDGSCPSTLDCFDAARPLEFVTRLYTEHGIGTYVVGLSAKTDSPYYTLLEGMALGGGHPRTSRPFFFAGTDEKALNQILEDAFRETAGCFYQLPSPLAEGTDIELRVAGALVEPKTRGPVGWTWASYSRGRIVLHDATCAQAKGKQVTATTVCR